MNNIYHISQTFKRTLEYKINLAVTIELLPFLCWSILPRNPGLVHLLLLHKNRKEPRVKNKQAKKFAKDRMEGDFRISSTASKVKIALPAKNKKLPR